MSRILLVGKEPHLIEALRLCLESKGHHTITALDGMGALELVSGRLPDMVVTDSKKLDKLALSKLLRHVNPGKGIPVILLSDGRQPVDGHAPRFDAYVQKPVAVGQLLTVVSQLT
ncbi:response regulator [Paraburkholderia strydomiana]|uniref:response regulator n=1 Tax=Paraburkholderia strydomiana TaxID=1245417 RepID=UPI001BE67B88|nr:response regulator [Paraburkholderia strydomiana]MBT2790141.1 response regulator [Paraburkholderia strydomiana]